MMRMLMIRPLMMRARMMRQPVVATKRQRKALAHAALSDYDPSRQIPVHCDGLHCVQRTYCIIRIICIVLYCIVPLLVK